MHNFGQINAPAVPTSRPGYARCCSVVQARNPAKMEGKGLTAQCYQKTTACHHAFISAECAAVGVYKVLQAFKVVS